MNSNEKYIKYPRKKTSSVTRKESLEKQHDLFSQMLRVVVRNCWLDVTDMY